MHELDSIISRVLSETLTKHFRNKFCYVKPAGPTQVLAIRTFDSQGRMIGLSGQRKQHICSSNEVAMNILIPTGVYTLNYTNLCGDEFIRLVSATSNRPDDTFLVGQNYVVGSVENAVGVETGEYVLIPIATMAYQYHGLSDVIKEAILAGDIEDHGWAEEVANEKRLAEAAKERDAIMKDDPLWGSW